MIKIYKMTKRKLFKDESDENIKAEQIKGEEKSIVERRKKQ